eukprot:1839756-Prymnesium_polylepis.2
MRAVHLRRPLTRPASGVPLATRPRQAGSTLQEGPRWSRPTQGWPVRPSRRDVPRSRAVSGAGRPLSERGRSRCWLVGVTQA